MISAVSCVFRGARPAFFRSLASRHVNASHTATYSEHLARLKRSAANARCFALSSLPSCSTHPHRSPESAHSPLLHYRARVQQPPRHISLLRTSPSLPHAFTLAFTRPMSTSRTPAACVIKKSELEELLRRRKANEPGSAFVLIDVREPREVAESGMIETAVHIPLGVVMRDLQTMTADEFAEAHGFGDSIEPTRDPVIFYCRSGARSAVAQAMAEQRGFARALNYEGSATEWGLVAPPWK